MVLMTCKCFLAWNSENLREGNGGEKRVFIELMKKGKEDKMQSEYSENMLLGRYCTEKVSCGGTSETPVTPLLLAQGGRGCAAEGPGVRVLTGDVPLGAGGNLFGS